MTRLKKSLKSQQLPPRSPPPWPSAFCCRSPRTSARWAERGENLQQCLRGQNVGKTWGKTMEKAAQRVAFLWSWMVMKCHEMSWNVIISSVIKMNKWGKNKPNPSKAMVIESSFFIKRIMWRCGNSCAIHGSWNEKKLRTGRHLRVIGIIIPSPSISVVEHIERKMWNHQPAASLTIFSMIPPILDGSFPIQIHSISRASSPFFVAEWETRRFYMTLTIGQLQRSKIPRDRRLLWVYHFVTGLLLDSGYLWIWGFPELGVPQNMEGKKKMGHPTKKWILLGLPLFDLGNLQKCQYGTSFLDFTNCWGTGRWC